MKIRIDQKPAANRPPGVWFLGMIIITMVAMAYVCFFQENQQLLAGLQRNQNRAGQDNALPAVSAEGLSGFLLGKGVDTSSKITSASAHGGKTVLVFKSIILQKAQRYQIEPALIRAIIMAESGYNPKAVSKKGAQGLMQLMPATAKALGVVDSFNPEHNIDAGVKYFKQMMIQFEGDVILSLAAYHAGSRRVREHAGVPPIGATRHYIKKVVKYYQIYKAQMTVEKNI